MQIFADKTRTDMSTKRPTESCFTFYDRVGRPYFQQLRDLMNTWVAALPASMSARKTQDFMSARDDRWHSAFWETYLYMLFNGLGYIVEYEPQLPHSPRHPDFLVSKGSQSAYVEARTFFGDTASEKRRAAVDAAIGDVNDPRFWLSVHYAKEGRVSPSITSLKRQLTQWLSQLDPNAVSNVSSNQSLEDKPAFTWIDRGWHVDFHAYLKPASSDGRPSPTIAVSSSGVYPSLDRERIHRALSKKARHYGRLDRPLIVALYSPTELIFKDDVIDALYGQTAVNITFAGDGRVIGTRPVRQANGVWRGPLGQQYRRTSAILLAHQLGPSSLLSSLPQLWLHPNPDNAVEFHLPFVTHAVDPDSERLVTVDNQDADAVRQAFALPLDWASGDPWRD